MQTLLKSVEIDSYPVLVDWSMALRVLPVPTMYQFNHAMLYIPSLAQMGKTTYFIAPVGVDFNNVLDLTKFTVTTTRQFPFIMGKSKYIWDDNITLPIGYKVKMLPQNINFKNHAGNYQITY